MRVIAGPISSSPLFPLPSRKIFRRDLDTTLSMDQLEQWAKSVEIKLGPLIPDVTSRLKVLQLLHTYRPLNGNDLTDLPCTNLIVHRVCLKEGTKPASVRSQKRWPAHIEWWLRKLVSIGIQGGIYEHTVTANGRFSAWNARAVLVDKVPNPLPTDEPRLTFDYHQVHEDLPSIHMELSARVHDSLSDPLGRFEADKDEHVSPYWFPESL